MSLPDLLAELEQALLAETAALRANDVDALGNAVASKRTALTELARIRPTALAGSADHAAAAEILARCRSLNDVAGSAISVLRQDTDHALRLLGVESEAPDYGAPRPTKRPGRALAIC